MAINDWLGQNSGALLQASAGLLGGRTGSEQAGMGLAGFGNAMAETKQKNKTLEFLKQMNPELAQAVEAGALSPLDAYRTHVEAQAPIKPDRSFQTLPDGTYGFADNNSGTFNPLGQAQKPSDQSNDYAQRQAAAAQIGLTPDNPAYQSYVLTGKMPREDQTSLTAVDKKAILEADDMVAVNENAISALDSAIGKSEDANSGWLAGARATIGNNLPDIMVPDTISSPESSAATTDYDNAVVGQALGQLKAIFGGAPTEGERAILLQLQGSSNLPKPVRDSILKRAKALAEKRLEFNRERATSLRGGTFYKPGQAQNSTGTTKSGLTFTVEPE
jgi:hypothetical protein